MGCLKQKNMYSILRSILLKEYILAKLSTPKPKKLQPDIIKIYNSIATNNPIGRTVIFMVLLNQTIDLASIQVKHCICG